MRSAVIAKSRSSTFSFLKQRSPSFIEVRKPDSIKIEPLIYPKNVEDKKEIEYDLLFEGCEAGKHVTEAEYWDEYHVHPDFRYEYNDGILELKPMPDLSVSEINFFTCDILREFVKVYPIATIVSVDVGFKLKLPNKTSVRKPDIGIILKSNPVQLGREEGTYAGCFDFCIELLSHSSKKVRMNDIVVKKLEYSQFGVKEYYIIDEYGKNTFFYRLKAKGQYETIPEVNGIIESTVLPGFRFRVSDLYTQPNLLTLINDKVYSHYVMVYYQEAKQKEQEAKQEAQEAKQEAQEAKQEAQEAKQKEQEARQKEQEAKQKEQEAKQKEQEAKQEAQEAKQKEQEARQEAQEARQKEQEARQEAQEARQKEQEARQEAQKLESIKAQELLKANQLIEKLKLRLKHSA